MTAWACLTGLAVGGTVLATAPPRGRVSRRAADLARPAPAGTQVRRRSRLRVPPVPVAVATAACWAALDGGDGLGLAARSLAAALTVQVLLRLLARAREDRSRAARRSRLTRQLPVAVDLLSACLEAGATIPAALSAVTGAMPGPVREALCPVVRSLALGGHPERAWREVAADPELAALGRALGRAGDGGIPVAGLLARVADDLREAARADSARRAQTVAVRVVLPLGLCQLPAFVLLGVVPTVVGLVAGAL